MLRLSDDPDGRDLDLGPTIECLRAFGEMEQLEPGPGFDDLHWIPWTDEEVVTPAFQRRIATQAREFLRLHRGALSPHAAWILEQLASLVD